MTRFEWLKVNNLKYESHAAVNWRWQKDISRSWGLENSKTDPEKSTLPDTRLLVCVKTSRKTQRSS